MNIPRNSTLGAGLISILLVISTFNDASGQPFASTNATPPWAAQDGPAYVPGEVLLKYRNDVTDDQIAASFRGAGLQFIKQIQTAVMRDRADIGITRAITAMPVEQVVEFLNRLPGVEYAQPNWVYTHNSSNDPYFLDGSLWGMLGPDTSPQRIYGSGAATAWVAGSVGSKNIYIGIIDEGIQYDHPDLSQNIWVNLGEGPTPDGKDNDENGYVDDIYGWNGFDNNGNIYDAASDDHGTHVAGTIGGQGGNGMGVVGVNWTANLVSGKFLGPGGGTTADAIEVIDYMTHLKTRKACNVIALNNSWGGVPYDAALLESIVRAANADILFVAAAGNGDWRGRAINTDSKPSYPSCYNTTTAAGYDSVIAVTAIASDGSKAPWANYGATTVDLGAPGVDINSTLPGGTYGSYSGTSMATPHVTGAIALYAAKYPGATAAAIRNALLASTAPTASLSGKTATGGRLDIPAFLATVPEGWTPPDSGSPAAPTGLAVTDVTSTTVTLTWADNSNNETSFALARTVGTTTTTISVGANLTSYTDTGLTPETEYTYSIFACKGDECVAGEPAFVTARTPEAPPLATVSFIGEDTVTKGTWLLSNGFKYGSEGYDILNYEVVPAAGTITPSGYLTHTWASSTTDTRALQTPSGSSRFAACYYSGGSVTIDVNFTDGKAHKISLYCVDYDRQGRTQSIEIRDRNTGKPLHARSISSFGDGRWLSWNIKGPVLIEVIYAGGDQNAVVSGIFVDAPVDPPPVVSITSPTSGSTVAGDVTLVASATDEGGGVTGVEFFAGTTSVGFGTAAANGTWAVQWISSGFSDGSYQVTAKATDTAGQTSTSSAISITVDNIDDVPNVSVVSPAEGASVSGSVVVSATATDDRGVSQVEFYAGGTSIGTDIDGADGWSVAWDTTGLDGAYVLSAVATDSGNQTASDAVNVTVDNTVPSTMHVGDLDGTKTSSGSTWKATVTVTVHDGNHNPVANASVNGKWSGGFTDTVTGQTGQNGQVTFQTGSLAKNKASVTFTIDSLKGALTYDAQANHDPDGDSNGTSITVTKP